MNDGQLRTYARDLIEDHVGQVEFTSIFEMWDVFGYEGEISEEDARKVLDLIHSAHVEVSW